MWWRLILKYCVADIQFLDGVDNMVSDTFSISPYIPVDNYNPSTVKSQCHTNKLFAFVRDKNNEDRFPLNLLNMQR